MPSVRIPNGIGTRDARNWVSNPSLGAMTWLSLRRQLKYLPMIPPYTKHFRCRRPHIADEWAYYCSPYQRVKKNVQPPAFTSPLLSADACSDLSGLVYLDPGPYHA